MLSRLTSLLGRENSQCGETRVRKKKVDPRYHWKVRRNKWSWGRHGEFRDRNREFSGCDGLENSQGRAQDLGASEKE